ncbi:MAG TPA: hypothetical protein VFL57_04500 [Bryobacteraceae bacterium]|nr:hypothetical protein [Bryobacteraceae bacterium]
MTNFGNYRPEERAVEVTISVCIRNRSAVVGREWGAGAAILLSRR